MSQGAALCYYDKSRDDKGEGALCGLIDLRELVRLRHSEDDSAPEFALDIVTRERMYTVVPQPATERERDAWLTLWVHEVPMAALSPDLREFQACSAL